MSKRFNVKGDNENIITDHGHELTISEVVKKLNDYENTRLRKNKEIGKLRKREEMYRNVIYGFESYLNLKFNNDLWDLD